ncbi:MAG: hypothetical protein M0Z71_04695 [Nitrospiraceae bacterium]|nr:hypothetical protein [Nitrospiraceae bacterium]
MLRQRQIILAKVEPAYATDAAPVPATNSILAELADIKIVGRALERNNVKSYFGKLATVNVGDALKIDFVTELKASGAAGTVPEIGVLFRGCNFTETIQSSSGAVVWVATTAKSLNNLVTPTVANGFYYKCTVAGTTGASQPAWPTVEGQTVVDGTVTWTCMVAKVDYDPNSNTSTSESLSLYFYLDGLLHKLLGCRGTFSMDLKSGEYGKGKWSFTGLYAKPTDQALVTGTYNQTIPPRFLSANFSIDAYAAIIENMSIDCGNLIVKRTDANHATGIREYFIKDRQMTGSIDPEATLIGTKDFYSMWDQSSRVAFAATVGQVAGNKCIITGPKVSLGELDYGDREGTLTLPQKLNFTPNAGNDEIKFSFQ